MDATGRLGSEPKPGYRPCELVLGEPAHIAFVVDNLAEAQESLGALGWRWSSVERPSVRLQTADGREFDFKVDYVTTSGSEPRLKLLSIVDDTLFEKASAGPHHVSYWVDDIEGVTRELLGAGWQVEATGLENDGNVRYRYLTGPSGMRIELGMTRFRDEFDGWANYSES